MSTPAPQWAFTAEAIDAVGDDHLPEGVHVRALPSPRLGLPATPLVVTRIVLTPGQVKEFGRSDGVTWIDSHGATRTVPFDVTLDNPVTGYFPVPDVVFAELIAAPSPAPPQVHGIPGGPLLPAISLSHLPPVFRSFLRFEALASSALGLVPFQSRDAAPYALAARALPVVRVVGNGTVRSIRWLDANRVKQPQEMLWEVWSLPVAGPTPRYLPRPTSVADAQDRIQRAAVVRQPMYVAWKSAGPPAAPPATPQDALKRVDQVRPDIDKWLDRLLNDTSKPIQELTDDRNLSTASGSISVPMEPFVIAGAVDPDVGHYLGFGDNDRDAGAPKGSLVLYRIRGLWRWDAKRWSGPEALAFSTGIRAGPKEAVKEWPILKELGLVPEQAGPFVDLYAAAVAIIGSPPSVPGQVTIDLVEDRGWLATPPPPDVRRALRLVASGFLPHPVAVLTATDSFGDRTLNPYPHIGRLPPGKPPPGGTPLPIIVSRPGDTTVPGQGRFEDRDAPGSAIHYRLAQGDWFGRWGVFSAGDAPAKARTPPMRPTVELYPQPPIVGSPAPTGPLSGLISVRIPIPRTADLPPGGAALSRLDLDETFTGSSTTTAGYDLSALPGGASVETHPAPDHDVLVIPRTGPARYPSTSLKVSYTARWVDSLGQVSANSDPAVRTIVDPRPPPLPAVETELRYTARPDSQGHARVDLDFASTPGTRYRVYASTEVTLLKALDDGGHTLEASDIRGAAPGALRAMKFRSYKGLFGWDHFECLTKQSIVATGTTTHFVHRVSGSLDVLVIYRVISEGESGALADLTQADLVPFAVPNLGGPPQPLLSVLNSGLDPTTAGVALRVKVPVGKAKPKAWRLRRASVPTNDPLRMSVVAEDAVSTLTHAPEGDSFDITVIDPLKAWRQYRFAVEVQADSPPGAPTVGVLLPGEWSQPSRPATLAVIPPAGPLAPSAVQIANVGGVLEIRVSHPAPDSLAATSMGPFRFELWRVNPDTGPEELHLLFTPGPGGAWIATDPAPADPGTYATVRIIDPIGRASDAVVSNTL